MLLISMLVSQQCENKFTARSDLVRHMLIHSGDRPFPCLECDAKFSTNVQLIAHGVRIHFIASNLSTR
jgi:KRAB domain-containing zinc finger protein